MHSRLCRVLALVALLGSAFLGASCASTQQSLTVAPIEADFPVSASSSLYVNGQTIDATQYQTIKPFTFEKILTVKIKERNANFGLGSELARVVADVGGNAIVRMSVAITNVDTNNLSWIALERYTGAFALTMGILEIALQSSWSSGSPGAWYALGGAGAVIIGGSILHENLGNITYSIRASGTVVAY